LKDIAGDRRWMAAALALARRAGGRTGSNPNVGCLIRMGDHVIGRGWTADGGRPHAEAMALAQAGASARGASAYVTLEPCAHKSPRGPSCTDSLIGAGVARVVVAMTDPDPRTAGAGIARLRAAGITVETNVLRDEAARELKGFSRRLLAGRPEWTLKLALSLDGRFAMADGTSQWITGERARLYAHLLRARSDMVIVGRGTFLADHPRLDVRLPGYNGPQPLRGVIGSIPAPPPFLTFDSIGAVDRFAVENGLNRLLCEGGGHLAAGLLADDHVDQLILLRAPILIGAGQGLEALQPSTLAATHDRWDLLDRRPLGTDLLEVYARRR